MTRGKHPLECTIIDIYTTLNSAGAIVRERYVASHQFCGQTVIDTEVCETTVAIGVSLMPQTSGVAP